MAEDGALPDKTVAIVGVGLIGGSLGLGLKRLGLARRVVGVSRPDTLARARDTGAIDDAADYADLPEAVAGADVVFLCTPIARILELLPATLASARPGTVVTDVGSTKRAIVEEAERHRRYGVHFIGGHPMAGSEYRGVDAADPFLFQNAIYVVAPSGRVPEEVTTGFCRWVERLGARTLRMEPDIHDRVAAAVSHLPQLMATALVGMVGLMNEDDGLPLRMAAGGFRDMTRIASSPYEVWRDICRTNSGPIRDTIDRYVRALLEVRSHIDGGALEDDFSYANRVRGGIPKDSKGFLSALFEVLVEVEDRPGVVAEVGAALAGAGVNIKDIEVMKVREGEGGTMRLGFGSPVDADRAVEALGKIGYRARKR